MKDIEDLLSYLDVARNLESSLIELTEIENKALAKISDIEHRTYPGFVPPKDPEMAVFENTEIGKTLGACIGSICGLVFGIIIAWYYDAKFSDLLFVLFFALILAVIGFKIGKLIGWLPGKFAGIVARTGVEKENRRAHELWKEKQRLKRQEDEAAVIQFRVDTLILADLKNELRKMLDEHYTNGPIYLKYRTLPAICQLYEYFDSGRFTELGDAYNQYELEVRLDCLIDNSEKALKVLYQIRDNQRVLFDTLLSVRDSIDSVNGNIDRCFQELDDIAYTQEISALCLQQTAAATTQLSQIEYYKQRHDLPPLVGGYQDNLIRINAGIESRKRRLAR